MPLSFLLNLIIYIKYIFNYTTFKVLKKTFIFIPLLNLITISLLTPSFFLNYLIIIIILL